MSDLWTELTQARKNSGVHCPVNNFTAKSLETEQNNIQFDIIICMFECQIELLCLSFSVERCLVASDDIDIKWMTANCGVENVIDLVNWPDMFSLMVYVKP